jgi:cation/acetate symporter
MLALFCGTASLPHILIRYYTVKDQISARKSTVVGIAAIGFFYVLTLYLGLGAMTSGTLDVTDSNMAAPLLARSFGELLFADHLGGRVHDRARHGQRPDHGRQRRGGARPDDQLPQDRRWTSSRRSAPARGGVCVGIVAMALGIAFEKMNVNFLVGWAFNIAASANLPRSSCSSSGSGRPSRASRPRSSSACSRRWPGSCLSAQAFGRLRPRPGGMALVPFSQPAIVTIPLGFLVLVVVSLMTTGCRRRTPRPRGASWPGSRGPPAA